MVNWAPKWAETVNFNCIPFEPKFKVLKDFSNAVFSYYRLPMVKVSARSNNIWGSEGPKRCQFMDTESWQKTLKIFNFTTTYAILMKLTTDIYLNKVFHLAKSCGVSHRVHEGVNKKTLKISQKINFVAKFRPFLNTSKICSISDASSCLSTLVKKVDCFWGVLAKNQFKNGVKWHSFC